MKSLMARTRKRRIYVRISEATQTKLHHASESAAPKETGGLLLGWWEDDAIVIEDAAEVVDSAATGASWTRRQLESQAMLDSILADRKDHPLGYVGDWHCHPAPVGASKTDLASLVRASSQYQNPLALLIRLSDGTVRAYAAEKGRLLKAVVAS